MTTQTTITTPSTSTADKGVICGKFTGMLAAFQLNAYNTLIASGVASKIAHKVAVDYGSDLGRLMASDPDVAHKVGKVKADGNAKLSMRASSTIISKRSMSLVRIAQVMDELFDEKLLAARKLPELNDTLTEYVAECNTWASEQVWAEKK